MTVTDIIALVIVAGAAAYVIRRAWLRLRPRTGGACGCDHCPSAKR